ncbi:MAG: hypothetical protein A2Z20_01075 [Bdellovibrionales bacterium RBG_16_40_8]|nr:MAG: hypothetical protein A2Z20_01075 [Bdellovibrionales bacterium RBG_16_40_8]
MSGQDGSTKEDPKRESYLDSSGRYWRIPKWFPELQSDLQSRLRDFHAELIHFNGRMNLISPRTEKDADLIHIADGILGARAIFSMTNKREIYDFGAGNGMPGIVMALLDPSRSIIMVDKDARKVEFIKHCSARLKITNCTALHTRVEEMPAESVHCAVSRGLASIAKSLIMIRRVAAIDCEYFHFKGESWSTEVAGIPSQVLAHWELADVADYNLPEEGAKHSIVQTKRL